MIRPPLEVANIIRIHGSVFVERHRRWLTVLHRKVLRAIAACRTAALGGHIEQCDNCGQRAISYNSCLNRHCPKCQAAARQRWLEKRSAELLPVPYYHVVFTLPHVLAPLALQNKALIYGLLFRATAETLLQIAADPKHLGADIGFMAVLHTWGQTLLAHPHLHCVVPGGGLSADHQPWIPCGPKFFLPVEVLSVVFRGKFLEGLEQAFNQHKLTLAGQLAPLQSPFGVCRSAAHGSPARLGRLCEATLCWTSASPHLSLALYAPRCHRQLPTRFDNGGQSQLPMARLCPRTSDAHHDSRCP